MSRVKFYDPYLDVLGGGEKVLLTILEEVARSGEHDVVVMSPSKPDLERWRRLQISIDPQRLRWRRANQLSVTPLSAGADLLVTLVNHFPPLSLARHSVTIIQFPFGDLRDGHGPLGSLRAAERSRRLASYENVVCYSEYVAAEIRRRLHVEAPLVIAPPVDLPAASDPAPVKERKVISVGRFFPAADANNKKHDILIDAWRRLEVDDGARGWELHLVGGVHSDPESLAYLQRLRERAHGSAVHFHPNAPAEQLRELYCSSSLFWHATGYGERRAERYEHFGITTVEAMAYGCVPVVVDLGGQLEIVRDGENGRLWHTLPELVEVTRELISDGDQVARLRQSAQASSARFGKDSFLSAVRERILDPAGVAG